MTGVPDTRDAAGGVDRAEVPGSGWVMGASTLGAPGEPLEDVLRLLARTEVCELELRCPPEGPYTPEMTRWERRGVRGRIEQNGVRLLALATGFRLGELDGDPGRAEALLGYLVLAADLGARFVRVFPGFPADAVAPDRVPPAPGDRAAAEERAGACLARAAKVAEGLGVRVALETHDSHPRGRDLVRLLEPAGDGVGVIWDLLHPWRVGETPPETWSALSPWLRAGAGYVQIKDVASRRDLTPVLQGTGIVPLAEAAGLLASGGYRGPLSLEWERTWYPGVPPLSEALPAAVAAVRSLPGTHVPLEDR